MSYATIPTNGDVARAGFTPAQYEVVNMVSCLRGDEDVAALKAMLVRFIDSRLQDELDRLDNAGALSTATIEGFAASHYRTPYGKSR